MGITVRATAAAGSVLAAAGHGRSLGLVTLISWMLTASIGGYMLSTLIAGGGLRRRPRGGGRRGMQPGVLITHFSLALAGLLVWVCYLVTGWTALAWAAVALLMPAIGLGLSTVTIWTPFPHPASGDPFADRDSADHGPAPGTAPPGEAPAAAGGGRIDAGRPPGRITDEMLASTLADIARTGKLIDHMITDLLADPPSNKKQPLLRPSTLIPIGHGLGALATFLLAVLTAAGMR